LAIPYQDGEIGMKYWTQESAPLVQFLRQRLDTFYNSTENQYSAFESVSQQHPYWKRVIAKIQAKLVKTPEGTKVRLLEFGAGRTGFAEVLGDLRSSVVFTVQDVTDQNRAYLLTQADHVYIGDLSGISGTFDIVFSTFVWEHVTNPKVLLDVLLERVAPGGSLFLFSPRYDIPGYVPPALRHLSRIKGLWLSIWLSITRLATLLSRSGKFWIISDPALFHMAWFRDADAIHLVSKHDLSAYLRMRNVTISNCYPESPNIKASLLEKLLKLCVEIEKL
jgi:SAM-dependent methyltransferase